MGIFADVFNSLGNNPNDMSKFTGDEQQGIASPLLPELDLKMDDDELLKIADTSTQNWKSYDTSKSVSARRKRNKRYWKGTTENAEEIQDYEQLQDNVIFESIETLLPILTRENPEATVFVQNNPDGFELRQSIQDIMRYLSDVNSLKIKIKDATRDWSIDLLGAIKTGWDAVEDEITYSVVRPSRLMLDPNGHISAGKFKGDWIQEMRTADASTLIRRFPDKKAQIEAMVNGKLATQINYWEYWTKEYCFFYVNQLVLKKMKNPHFIYDQSETVINEFGEEVTTTIKKNHFRIPQFPYAFLTVFSRGEQPLDETTLIEQAIPLQDVLNKRLRQIDKNVDSMNNSIVFGADVPEDQASDAVDALNKGYAIRLPTNDVNKAMKRDSAPPLPQQVYQTVDYYRNEIMNLMGVRGSTPQGIVSEDTVGGKIAVRGQDIDRSSLIVSYIEQMVDWLFNLTLQMMYVYYDEEHAATILGNNMAEKYVTLSNKDLFNTRITVSVKEGSLLPKDSLTRRNEAMDLYSAGAIDIKTLHEMLETPDPEEVARRVVMSQQNPMALFEESAAQVAEQQTNALLPPEQQLM
jgi:hypothetical protein